MLDKFKAGSFITLLILLIFLFIESAFGILIQLARNANPKGLKNNWNALIVGLSYLILAFVSLGYYMRRSSSSGRRLTQLSVLRPVGPQLPPVVLRHVGEEYTRSCAIAAAALPFVEQRSGWGSPGTAFEGVRYRAALLDTIAPLHDLARQVVPHLPPSKPREPIMDCMASLLPLIPIDGDGRNCLLDWAAAIDKARDYATDVEEGEFLRGMQAAGKLSKIFDDYNMEILAASTTSTASLTDSGPPL